MMLILINKKIKLLILRKLNLGNINNDVDFINKKNKTPNFKKIKFRLIYFYYFF